MNHDAGDALQQDPIVGVELRVVEHENPVGLVE